MIGLTLWASEYRNLTRSEAGGVSPVEVPCVSRSSMSLPAVNTPEPPVMIRQRILGSFCALSIASLIARNISSVIAFFFSGRRSRITRVAASSVTMTCAVIKQFQGRPAASPAEIVLLSYMIPSMPQMFQAAFRRRRA